MLSAQQASPVRRPARHREPARPRRGDLFPYCLEVSRAAQPLRDDFSFWSSQKCPGVSAAAVDAHHEGIGHPSPRSPSYVDRSRMIGHPQIMVILIFDHPALIHPVVA